MPMTLNVGFSRKVGEPDYGSRGASVNLDVELDTGLLAEPARLRHRIQELFDLAQASVDEELQRTGQPGPPAHTDSTGGNGQPCPRPARRATQSQVRAIHAIADRQGIDLSSLLRERFQISHADDLSITEASQLIDELKGADQRAGGRR